MTENDESRLFPGIVKGSLFFISIITLASVIVSGRDMALGILAGGVTATVNFVWQRSVLQRILGLTIEKPQTYLLVRYVLRLAVTALFLYLLIRFTTVSVFGLLIGLSAIVINITVLSIYFAIRKGD